MRGQVLFLLSEVAYFVHFSVLYIRSKSNLGGAFSFNFDIPSVQDFDLMSVSFKRQLSELFLKQISLLSLFYHGILFISCGVARCGFPGYELCRLSFVAGLASMFHNYFTNLQFSHSCWFSHSTTPTVPFL